MGTVMAAGAAGCSPNEDGGVAATDEDAGTKDAGHDRGVPEEDSCAAKKPIDPTTIPYAKALRVPGACSNDEVKALTKYYSEHSEVPDDLSVAKWAETVSESCAACAFTASTAEAWGPLLVDGDTFLQANRGGCVEIASGKEACGRAYEQVNGCLILACFAPPQGGLGRCTTQAEFDACRNEVLSTGQCAGASEAVEQECGAKLSSYQKACGAGATNVVGAVIPAHCGGAAPGDGD